MPLSGSHSAGDGGHVADHNLIDAALAAKLDATTASGTYPLLSRHAQFPVGNYSGLQAAIDAANAAGGGVVTLPAGGTPVGPSVQMKSRVIVEGPPCEWSVWGYNRPTNDPTLFNTAWLVPDTSTTNPTVVFGSGVVNAGLSNVMVLGVPSRDGISFTADAVTRGGNRLRNVYVNGAKVGVYVGQREVRIRDLLVMACASDGVQVDAQDCEWEGGLVGYSGGNGLTLTSISGPIRLNVLDAFDNTFAGVEINGGSHLLSQIQTNNNGRSGVLFKTTTGSTIQELLSGNNGREWNGTTNTTRYANVTFAHPSASNSGCAVIGGVISTSDPAGAPVQDYGVRSSEAVIGFPRIVGVSFDGYYSGGGGGNSPFQHFSSLSSFHIQGCDKVPDMVMPQGGAAPSFRPNGTADQWRATDGSGNPLAGCTAAGALYAPTVQANGITGALNAGRFVGVTASGPPTAGTFLVADYVLTQNGQMYVCVTAGTPGTWVAPRDTTDLLSIGEETFSRRLAVRIDSAVVSGRMFTTCFTARKSETVTQVRTLTGSSAAATTTLCRIGLYALDSAGNGTLVASTANDTTLWTAANTTYTKAFSSSYAKIAGQRYALATLCVATTMPTWVTSSIDSTPMRTENAAAPRLMAYLGAQADLPATYTDASLTAFASPIYAAILP